VRDIYGLRAAIEGAADKLPCQDQHPASLTKLDEAVDAISEVAATGDTSHPERADELLASLLEQGE
jgi:DNA-binding GntR family transcriptional regulator